MEVDGDEAGWDLDFPNSLTLRRIIHQVQGYITLRNAQVEQGQPISITQLAAHTCAHKKSSLRPYYVYNSYKICKSSTGP